MPQLERHLPSSCAGTSCQRRCPQHMQSGDNGNFEGTKSYNDSKSFDCGQTQCHSYCGNVKGYNDERNVYREKGSRKYQSHRMTSGISLAQDNR